MALDLKKINKDYGNVATSGDDYPKAEFISSGIYKFDAVTGGGFARGHVTEVHGLEGSGKTTLCLQAVAAAQKEKMVVAWVDAEGRLNADRARELGVDLKKITVIRPQYGEQACDIMRDIIVSQEVDLLILDSLPALSSKNEIQATDGSGPVASQARMWASFLRKIIPGNAERKTAFVVINQMRENLIGMQGAYAPGAKDPYTYPGGKAQKYFASNRVEIKKLEKGGELGYKVRIKSVKTSFTKPFLETETFFDWERGFSVDVDILEMAIEKGIITNDKGHYSYKGEKIAFGQKKMRDWMDEHSAEIEAALTDEPTGQ